MTPEAAQVSHLPELADISREELLRRLTDRTLTIVDALAASSYEAEHIPGAISLPVAEVERQARQVLPNLSAEIAIYCARFT